MEELLELTQDDGDEEEHKDALELRTEDAAPAPPPPPSEMETQAGPQEAETARETAPEQEKYLPPALKAAAETAKTAALPEEPAEIPVRGGQAGGAGLETAPTEPVPAKLWRDGLEKVVTGPNGTPLLRRPGAGDVELPEVKGAKAQDGTEAGGEAHTPPASQRGLEGLYRQAAQAARPAAQALAAPQQGQAVRLGEPGTPRQLTVDELDRAVRRDSRRYDGGLEIF